MIKEDTLIIYDNLFKQVCFICKRDNSLRILSKVDYLRSFVENLIKKPVCMSLVESDGKKYWGNLQQITVDEIKYMRNLYELIKQELISNNIFSSFSVDFLENVKRSYIDAIIKRVWLSYIPLDYNNKFLLYEDSLKSSMYHHLRTELAELMDCTYIRIFPEYQTYRKENIRARIDLAIVEFKEFYADKHLADSEIEILSAIEFKFVGCGKADDDAIFSDVKKCISYLKKLSGTLHIYISYIQEAIYDSNDYKLLDKKKIKSKERITELLGFIPLKNEQSEKMEFKVVNYS